MKIQYADTFVKAVRKLTVERASRVKKTLDRFIEAPDQPGLRLHKLDGVDAWSLSSGRKDRIIMRKIQIDGDDIWRVMDVGAHDQVYRRINRR